MTDQEKIAELIRCGEALNAELTRLCIEHNDRSCEFDINKAVREWYWLVRS